MDMTAKQFNDALTKLRLSVYASAPVLGISLRQAQRYSSGEQEVSGPVANQLTLLVDMVTRWKAERKKNQKMIDFFENKDLRARIHSDGKDITSSWVATLRDREAEWESLLRRPPGSGLPSQID
jgi:hypothetical protein